MNCAFYSPLGTSRYFSYCSWNHSPASHPPHIVERIVDEYVEVIYLVEMRNVQSPTFVECDGGALARAVSLQRASAYALRLCAWAMCLLE